MNNAIDQIFNELRKAEETWHGWPIDPVHAAAVLAEEAGELVQAANNFYWSKGARGSMAVEAAQVGAMAIRFLCAIDNYKRRR